MAMRPRARSIAALLLLCSAAGGAAAAAPAAHGSERPPAHAAGHPAEVVPQRVYTMALYQGNGENVFVPATFMAANYDWTEQAANATGAQYAASFHAAGGAHAVLYTVPNARECSSGSGKPGTCTDIVSPEIDALRGAAWLHRAGDPKRRAYAKGFQRNNPLDPLFRAAWIDSIANFLTDGGGSSAWSPAEGGAVELDTMNWVNLTTFTGAWGPFAEITSDAQVLAAQEAVVGYTPARTLLDGVNYDYPLGGAYDALLSAVGENVAGVINREAFATDYAHGAAHDGYLTERSPIPNAWQNQENAILDVIGRGKTDIVWMLGGAGPQHRLYGVASFWLSYDPHRSVLWEDFCARESGGCDSTWPDAGVVPTRPLQSATTDISALRSGNLYVREFAACYQNGKPIGGCAAIVNPTLAAQPFPALQQQYAMSVVLPAATLYAGGTVGWQALVTAPVAPRSAIILSNA